MLKKIHIVSIIDECNWACQALALNSNIETAGYDNYTLVVYYQGPFINAALQTILSSKVQKNLVCLPLELNTAQILNKELYNQFPDYFCFLDSNMYHEKNWLSKMLFDFELIDRVGAVIIPKEKRAISTQLLCQYSDELVSAQVPEIGYEKGTLLISQLLIDKLGAFYEQLCCGYEFVDYCRRAALVNYHVIYAESNSVVVSEPFQSYYMTEQAYLKAIESLPVKSELDCMTPEMEANVYSARLWFHGPEANASNHPIKVIEDRRTNTFAIASHRFLHLEMLSVIEFAKNVNLGFTVISGKEEVFIIFSNN